MTSPRTPDNLYMSSIDPSRSSLSEHDSDELLAKIDIYHNRRRSSTANTGSTDAEETADPDRHTRRPSKTGGRMKCERCSDYNRGVMLGSCRSCGHINSVFR